MKKDIGGTTMNTPQINKTLKEKQKLLEKIEIFTYAFEYKGQKYAHGRYVRFNKTSGILIVTEEGELPPREIAQEVCFYFNLFNTYMKDLLNIINPEANKPYTPLEELDSLIDETFELANIKDTLISLLTDYKKHLDVVLENKKIVMTVRDRMVELYDHVLDKNLLTVSDYDKTLEYLDTYNLKMYETAYHLSDMEKLASELKKHIKKADKSTSYYPKLTEIVKRLEYSLDRNARAALKESLELLNRDEYGKKVQLPKGEEGSKELIKIYERKRKYTYSKIVAPHLRNN